MNKRIDASQLDAAMTTTEPQVDVPNRRQTGSMRSQVEALSPGEHCSKTWKCGEQTTIEAWIEHAAKERERMRNSVTGAVAAARERTGGTYTIEVADIVVACKLYVIAIVTRTA